MTNEQINKMAAEALGIKGWHRYWKMIPDTGECGMCYMDKANHIQDNPDFCDDLNAAQRFVNYTVQNGRRERLRDYGHALVCASPYEQFFLDEILLLPAKTITLACLVALGKITLEEAKENV